MKYHPDLNKDDEQSTEKFTELKEAYDILMNDKDIYEQGTEDSKTV